MATDCSGKFFIFYHNTDEFETHTLPTSSFQVLDPSEETKEHPKEAKMSLRAFRLLKLTDNIFVLSGDNGKLYTLQLGQ